MRAGALEIMLMADLSRLRQDMRDAQGVVGNSMGGMSKATDFLRGALV